MKGNYSQVSTTSEMKQSINIFYASENFGKAKDLLKLISFQVCALITYYPPAEWQPHSEWLSCRDG